MGRSSGNADAPRIQPVERALVRPERQEPDIPIEQRVRKVERRPTLPHRPNIERSDPVVATDESVRKAGRRPTFPHRPEIERGSGAIVAGDTVRNWRGRDRNGESVGSTIEDRNLRTAPGAREGGGLVQPRRELPRVFEPAERRVSRTPVLGTEPPAPRTAADRRAQPATRWSTDWHRDRRYDWRDWRRRHRSRFHFGWYYDPFGWDYFRYGVGWRLWPSYYRSSFWLRDPWHYRLPHSYGPYRWIRYHNDALLVNIYTGRVVDVVHDFFW